MQKDDPRKSLEISPQSIVIVQEMAARINQDGGIYSEKLLFFFKLKALFVCRYWYDCGLRSRRGKMRHI